MSGSAPRDRLKIEMENLTIYMLGGTSEANLAARHLESEGYRVVVSVATPMGAELAAASTVEVGSKDAAGMAESAIEAGAAAIVDCSHPFAVEASRAGQDAAGVANLPYLRFSRVEEPLEASHILCAEGWQQAVNYLSKTRQRSLLTIGVRHLHLFAEAGLDFAVRVLPTADSVGRCRELGINPAEVIAARPPHSTAFNRYCIRRTGVSVLVSKDSGREGGVQEKLEAAAEEGIKLLLISRPKEPAALNSLDGLVEALRQQIYSDPRN